jgi:hypothetical protein
MGIGEQEQMNLWKTVAAILHLGNINVSADRSDQARVPDLAQAELACHILGIPADNFLKGLLTPRVRAGREWVTQSRTKSQVLHSLDALAKTLYEKSFGYLVERINQSMDRPSIKSSFIGVLDIAGFEIFKVLAPRTSSNTRQTASNNCVSTTPMKNCSSFSTITCSFLNRRNTRERISSGNLLILDMICSRPSISSKSQMYVPMILH